MSQYPGWRPTAGRGARYKRADKEKRTCDGILFDSILEMNYYIKLKADVRRGDVLYFLRQVPFDLPGGVKYRCDFMVVKNDNVWKHLVRVHYIDVKGHETDMFKLKKKQVEDLYPVKIEVVT